MKIDEKSDSIIQKKVYTAKNGLPFGLNYEISKISDNIIVNTEKGFYQFNAKNESFISYPELSNIFDNEFIDFQVFSEDKYNQIWYWGVNLLSKEVVNGLIIINKDGSFNIKYKNVFNRLKETNVQFIKNIDNNNVFVGNVSGLAHFNLDMLKNYNSTIVQNCHIRKVEIIVNKDSLIFGGAGLQNKLSKVINYKYNSLRFSFSASFFNDIKSINYSYFLEGYDEDWSDWTPYSRKEYTNLPSGKYKFKVKAKDIYENISTTDEYNFTIHSPWFQQWWSIAIFIVIAIFFIYLLLKINTIRLIKSKRRLESIIKERTAHIFKINAELKQRNEEILQQNEKLNDYKDHLEQMVTKRTIDLIVAKENAERANKLKTSFIENISHEVRTPLNAITGFAEMLECLPDTTQIQLDYVKHIVTGSEVLLKMINSIMQVSEIESGNYKVNKTHFLINDLLNKINTEFNNSSILEQKKDLKIELLPNEQTQNLTIYSDYTCIDNILFNLINNAVKFTERGKITFGLDSKSDSLLKFFVKDTGIGISDEDILFIFDQFRKIQTENTKLYRGLGLGLSIARNMVHLLDGEIMVKSEIGKGTVFCFTIPYEL